MPTIRRPAPPLPIFVDGAYVTQRQLNAFPEHIAQLYASRLAGFRTRKPLVILTAATGSVPYNAYQILGFNTEIEDTDSMWSSGSTITINTPGIYLVELQIAFVAPTTTADANPYTGGVIYANGVNTELDTLAIARSRMAVGQPSQVTVAVPAALDSKSVLRFAAVQTGASGQSLNRDDQNGGTKVTVEWLAPLDTKRGAVTL